MLRTIFSTTVALAFGKPVAKNDAHVIRRRLPPLSPQIKNLRGPRTLETYGEADRSNECEIRTQRALKGETTPTDCTDEHG